MKHRIKIFTCLFLLCLSIGIVNSQTCKIKYKLNPKSFLDSTELLRKHQNYDEIIRIISDRIKKDSTEIWPYYQLACTYSLKGDTILPFQYLYKYIDLKEFAEDIFSDSDFDKLLPTYSWKCLKDTIHKVYLSKYPNISVVRDLYSRTLLLLGFVIRLLFIHIILLLQPPIFLSLLNNLLLNYIYNPLANIQILL